jgi:WbqC-like protein
MKFLTEFQYFPSIIFYKNLYACTNIIFEQYECYQKMSFRNRCLIAGANGVIHLSIPLEDGRSQKKLMKDVRIDSAGKWQNDHWKSIVSCYNKSPWFEFYKDELRQLYEKRFDFLQDWDLACFTWSIQKLGLHAQVSVTKEFIPLYGDSMIDFRNKILPKNYRDFEPLIYHQVFESKTGFMPNLSILDLLFCEGKRAGEILSS